LTQPTAPIFSVVIPTFNRASLLPRALDSILAQTFADYIAIIVDDCSTDSTPSCLPSLLTGTWPPCLTCRHP
jgi:glycosyltransferase involved in cell wall biosynthesis